MKEETKDTFLIDCMCEIPDPRALYNQRHKFLDIIIIANYTIYSRQGMTAAGYGGSARAREVLFYEAGRIVYAFIEYMQRCFIT